MPVAMQPKLAKASIASVVCWINRVQFDNLDI
jgi:hypothetical protein